MDKIFLRDLRIETIVGIWDWERKMPQKVSIDLDLAANMDKAAASDSVEATVNYKEVVRGVTELVQKGQFKLVETMAVRIAELLLNDFDVPWVRVRVNKPGAIRNSRDVGVEIERGSVE